jgi:tetratricopeptide (TPR) repeat protein
LTRWLAPALLLAALGPALQAQQVNIGGQSQAFSLLDRGVGARALGMGSAFEAVDGDSASAVYNPASAGFLRGYQLGVHHDAWIAGTYRENLTLNAPLGSLGGAALLGSWISYPGLELRDSQGQSQGQYQPSDQALGLSWAIPLSPQLAIGLSAKGLREDIPGNSYLGASYQLGFLLKASSALQLAGLARSMPQASAPSSQALTYVLSASGHAEDLIAGPVTAALSVRLDSSSPAELSVGLEKGFRDMLGLNLRVGYSSYFPSYNLGSMHGMSLGVGFRVSGLELNYAWLPMGDFGSAQQLSLAWNFAQAPEPQVPKKDGAGAGRAAGPPLQKFPQQAGAAPVQATATAQPKGEIAAPAPGLEYRVLSDAYVKAQALEAVAKRQALNAYLQAVKEDPKDAMSWRALGRLYESLGKAEWAKRCNDEADKLEAPSSR